MSKSSIFGTKTENKGLNLRKAKTIWLHTAQTIPGVLSGVTRVDETTVGKSGAEFLIDEDFNLHIKSSISYAVIPRENIKTIVYANETL